MKDNLQSSRYHPPFDARREHMKMWFLELGIALFSTIQNFVIFHISQIDVH